MSVGALLDIQSGFVFGEWQYPMGGSYGPTKRSCATLLMTHRGAARVCFDGQERPMVAGECAVFVNWHSLSIAYQKHLKTHVSWCEAVPARPAAGLDTPETGFARKLPISARLDQLQKLGIGLGLESGRMLNELRNALGLAVFSAYLFESRRSEEQHAIPNMLMRVRRYIDEHFAREMSLADIADVAALTPTHLVAAFSRHFGTTPIRYLWSVRAARARQLLLHTGLSNAQIAFRCGYKSPYHFSRHIKECFGMPPTVLRDSKAYLPPSNAEGDVIDITLSLFDPGF